MAALLLPAGYLYGQSFEVLPFRDTRLSLDERVGDLMDRLTLEEKISLLNVTGPPIERLGIPSYHYGNEALHGVVRPGKATVFPQAIGLAATWNPGLMYRVATAISDEARGKDNGNQGRMTGAEELGGRFNGLLTFFSPTVNMARDPRWGRTAETYGEDPLLTSRMGVAFVKGMQGNQPRYLKTICTPKHFVANNEEHNRFSCNVVTTEESLRNYYMKGFEACIREAGAGAIMTAYNAINGVPCSVNHWLLQDILRKEWGFKGYVVTDCGAVKHLYESHQIVEDTVQAAALAINAGVDLECGPDIFPDYLGKAVEMGLVHKDTIDRALRQVLLGRFRLGLFDPRGDQPYTRIPPEVVGSDKHVKLALQAALESIVLLKNDTVERERLLPLDSDRQQTIVVVGPNAERCQFGDYSGIPANHPVSPLEGLRKRAGQEVHLIHVPWSTTRLAYVPIPGCWTGEYYDNPGLKDAPSFIREDARIDFDWKDRPPDPLIVKRDFSISWKGKLIAPETGTYQFAVESNDGVRLSLAGKNYVNQWFERSVKRDSFSTELQAGETYELDLHYFNRGSGDPLVRLEWIPPHPVGDKEFSEEIKAASDADVVIAFLGLGDLYERESVDREDLDLPPDQQKFIRLLYQANPRTIVVLINGSPLTVNWINEHVPAILEAWYPGEQGGNALARVLFGDYNPAGRLPLTFYRSLQHLTSFDDYDISAGRTYMYLRGEPLYAFGYGISYTNFSYADLELDPMEGQPGDTIRVSLRVSNTGQRNGEEVVQLYAGFTAGGNKMPGKMLIGFQRVLIPAGESRDIAFQVCPCLDLKRFDPERNNSIVPAGNYRILAGSSSADIRLEGSLYITD